MALGPWITAEDRKAVDDVLASGDLMSGKQVALFEAELAAYLGKRHVVCVSSGTAALETALHAVGVHPLVHPHNYVAMLSAARTLGSFTHSGHTGFRGSEYSPLVTASLLGVSPTIEIWGHRVHDAAHAFGTPDLPGDVHCYSFNQNKFIACVGGCIATDDGVVAAKCRQHRNHGRDGGPEIFSEGRNHRMGEMNAALGRSQLRRIFEILSMRAIVASFYDAALGQNLEKTRASWFLYPVACKTRNHGFRSMADFRLFNSATDEDYRTALLPVWPCMTKEDVDEIVGRLKPCL